MSRENLRNDVLDMMIDTVTKRMANVIQGLRVDESATAEEHKLGLRAGFNQAKRQMLDALFEGDTPC
jgi:hypothetical protein